MEGVTGVAIAADFGNDSRTALFGVLFGFKHHHARAFADDETASAAVKTAGSPPAGRWQ